MKTVFLPLLFIIGCTAAQSSAWTDAEQQALQMAADSIELSEPVAIEFVDPVIPFSSPVQTPVIEEPEPEQIETPIHDEVLRVEVEQPAKSYTRSEVWIYVQKACPPCGLLKEQIATDYPPAPSGATPDLPFDVVFKELEKGEVPASVKQLPTAHWTTHDKQQHKFDQWFDEQGKFIGMPLLVKEWEATR